MRDARVSFDKYLRFYAKDSKHLKRQRRDWHIQEKTELESFKTKWADFLVDEHDNSDDIRPMLGLDSYDPAPKPYKIFSRYEVSKTLERNKINLNMMFDREMQRVKSNKDSLRGFLMDQQQWLANMKTEIASCKTFGAGSFAHGSGISGSLFHPRQIHRDGSIDALRGVRVGPDFL